MDSSELSRNLNDTLAARSEAHAPSGRSIERYHYRDGQSSEGLVQSKGSPVFLEQVPALLQAAGFH